MAKTKPAAPPHVNSDPLGFFFVGGGGGGPPPPPPPPPRVPWALVLALCQPPDARPPCAAGDRRRRSPALRSWKPVRLHAYIVPWSDVQRTVFARSPTPHPAAEKRPTEVAFPQEMKTQKNRSRE